VKEISVRELRNNGGQILDRVEGGESVTVTRDGTPVAVLSPLPAPRFSSVALLEKWKNVPVIDGDHLRNDIGEVLDLDL